MSKILYLLEYKKRKQTQRVEAMLFKLRKKRREIYLPEIPVSDRQEFMDNLIKRGKLEGRELSLAERQAGLRIYQDLCRDLGLEEGDI